MINLTGLWAGESKSGKKYMKGSLGMAQVFIFKNDKKRSDKSPDYFLCIAEKPRDDGGQQGGGGQNQGKAPEIPSDPVDPNEIPF